MDDTNPQTFNRYAYVLNNPAGVVDPTGLDDCNPNASTCVIVIGTPPSSGDPGGGVPSPGGDPSDPCSSFRAIHTEHFPAPVGGGPCGGGGGAGAGGAGGGGSIVVLPITTFKRVIDAFGGCSEASVQSIDSYLQDKNSPLAGQGANFVASGSQYRVDPAFVVALAGAESSFGQNITRGTFNAWNWLYNGPGQPAPFSSWAAGINSVTRGIAGPYYFRRGLTSTSGIYQQYCSGPDCVNGLRNLNGFLMDLGGNPANVQCP